MLLEARRLALYYPLVRLDVLGDARRQRVELEGVGDALGRLVRVRVRVGVSVGVGVGVGVGVRVRVRWKGLEMPAAASMGSEASRVHSGSGSRPRHSRKPSVTMASGCVLRRGGRSETRDSGGGGSTVGLSHRRSSNPPHRRSTIPPRWYLALSLLMREALPRTKNEQTRCTWRLLRACGDAGCEVSHPGQG